MVTRDSLLVALVSLVECIPVPDPGPRRRGRPYFYSQRLFLKALIIMIVRHLHTVHSLVTVLEEPTAEMERLRALLCENGRYPTRRTFDRRLKALPSSLPAQIACLGRTLVALLQPWASCGRAAAIDSTLLTALGGVWHKKDREKGKVPHTSIDTEAHWTKSGWHGWVYGWKLHLITTVSWVWIPLAARLTAANEADNEVAPGLIAEADPEARYLLGDTQYDAPNVAEACWQTGRFLVASRHGPYPHTDAGVEVRRIFHMLRSRAIENFNEQFKAIFDVHAAVPTKGLVKTKRFVLGAVFLYQLTLLYRHQHQLDLRVGLKPFLKAA